MNARAIPALRPNVSLPHNRVRIDMWLLGITLLLVALGLIMVTSASISFAERQMGNPLYFFWKQSAYILAGLMFGYSILHLRLVYWERLGPYFLLTGFVLLVAVLILGREVNGSVRWLTAGPFNLQPSELIKLFMVVYMAGYLVRRGDEVRNTIKGFLKPMALVGIICLLLLMEPDFGAVVVVSVTVLAMMFLAGVRLWQFGILFSVMLASLAVLAISSPYRVERLTSFVNPWENPFDSGYQLTQALIAFGRGEWFGVGLGGSVQKLFYLPEAHTDFLFAVLAEELGLIGVLLVILLFTALIWRAQLIGRAAMRDSNYFGAYLSFGIGAWLGLQAFINLGVNMGVLPTKGLTLPLMSYGGSSLVVCCMACALLLRVSHEHPVEKLPSARRRIPGIESKNKIRSKAKSNRRSSRS